MIKFRRIDKRGSNLAIFQNANHVGAVVYFNEERTYRLYKFSGTTFTESEMETITRKTVLLNSNPHR